MFFKSMEMQGFKSFPDKTVLTFDTKMTAVVGSNGNGKSNLSDALRWVMGEQGAKTLRGDKMEDVIFHGTIERKPMGFAKVALVIDNTDRTLTTDADEVTIARKLYRTGDSEYLINNEKVRLKDIQELLMGTGLGRDGYSIIGQGRVAEVINSKGTQRRELFEEAAGVSKFLHRKDEAERDLQRANDNILRLKDIATELEERLPVLEKQSDKARKARVLMEQEKKLDISVSVYDLEHIDRALLDADDAILANQGECEHFEREISQLEKESDDIGEEKMLLSAKADELRQSGENARDMIAASERERAVLENEVSHNCTRIEQINEQISESSKGAGRYDAEIEDLNKSVSDKETEIAEIEKKSALLSEKLEAENAENSVLDEKQKDLDRRQGVLFAKRTEARLTIQQAKSQLDELNEQLSSAEKRMDSQEGLITEYREKRKTLSSELDKTTEEKQEVENKLGGYTKLFDGKNNRLEAQKAEFERARREYDQNKSRFEVLSDVEKNMAGYTGSVKSVILASKQGQISGIRGTVADIIHVDKKYGIAVEIALGAALQNIIVENEETAKRCMRYLKESGSGRATFLPLTSVKGNELDFKGLENEEGYEGIASGLVSFSEEYSGIIRFVLGRTAIVEDIDTATVIAKKYGYKFKIVTLDGQQINSGGSFTGGSVKEGSGIISRKQELESLEKNLVKAKDAMEISKGSLGDLQAEVSKMSIEIEGYKEQLSSLQKEEVRLTAEIGGVRNLIAQCEEQQDNAETILSRHKAQIAQQQAVVDKYTSELSDIEENIAALGKELSDANDKLSESGSKRSEISDMIASAGIEKLTAQKDIENLKSRIENALSNKRSLGEGCDALKNEIKTLTDKNESLRLEIETKRLETERLETAFTDHKDEVASIIEKTNSLEKRIGEINREIREKSEDKEKFSNALVLAQERKAAGERESDKIKTALWDKYELTSTEAYTLAQTLDNIRNAKNELIDLHRRITALGNVNFASIEEYDEVRTRYDDLSKQLSDVEDAKRELEKLIANLTADIKARFLSSFNDINDHFKRIFSEVFGGGSAHLELTDPDDVLSSGIEIFAAPPGKLIKNLISLSGGEQTMVAITIYFAILLHRPTPFCMLDEVDAALDDINVVKYITYLKRFSKQTQLMIITHRRGTIEGCDVLYGVFMQEKGVSRLLKQELGDELELELD